MMLLACVLAAIGGVGWVTDTITLQGERTVYLAQCRDGSWAADRCNGNLAAGARYRFRALKAHGEVLFWASGSLEPSGKLVQCVIADGRNWSCAGNSGAAKPITMQMAHGSAVPDPSMRDGSLHAVSKWRWWLLRQGISLGNQA